MKATFIVYLLYPLLLSSQNDTLHTIPSIPVSNEIFAHRAYWLHISHRDQDMRKSPNIEAIDEANMFSIIEYYNKFGFPDSKLLGAESKMIAGVWGHIRSSEIKKYTFPIILAGWKNNEIPEAAYREYYIRQMYQLAFDGNEYKTRSVEYLHTLLGLDGKSFLSKDTVTSMLHRYKLIRSDTGNIIGSWIFIQPADTFEFEGKALVRNSKNYKLILYKSFNEKYYLLEEAFANASEPVELVPYDFQLSKFKIAGKESSKYYFINSNGDLVYADDEKYIYKKYAVRQ